MHPNEQMEQIRELLIGEIVRRYEARIGALETRLKEVESRIEALGQKTTAERHAAFEELSRSVGELGERIRGLTRS